MLSKAMQESTIHLPFTTANMELEGHGVSYCVVNSRNGEKDMSESKIVSMPLAATLSLLELLLGRLYRRNAPIFPQPEIQCLSV